MARPASSSSQARCGAGVQAPRQGPAPRAHRRRLRARRQGRRGPSRHDRRHRRVHQGRPGAARPDGDDHPQLQDHRRRLRRGSAAPRPAPKNAGSQRRMAQIAVDAVTKVCDWERRDVNFDLIKMQIKTGGKLEETCPIEGVVLDKTFAPADAQGGQGRQDLHPDLPVRAAQAQDEAQAGHHHRGGLRKASRGRAEVLHGSDQAHQGGRLQHGLLPVGLRRRGQPPHAPEQPPRGPMVGGVEIELLAIATGGRIVPRFKELAAKSWARRASSARSSLATRGSG